MAKQIDSLVATLSYEPGYKEDIPMVIVGMGDPTSTKKPLQIVNAFVGDEAIDLWNKLTKPKKG